MIYPKIDEKMSSEGAVKKYFYIVGAAIGLLGFAAMPIENWHNIYAKGPPNIGHEKLACTDCHIETLGSVRQQLQAKVHYWLGIRNNDVEFGHANVGNSQCATCHAREQDSHPVHLFLEPRFQEARAEFGVHLCVSCHREHTGVRSTLPETSCSSCHKELRLKADPIDVPHQTLIANNNWASCLGCHDYHNNHRRVTQKSVKDAYSTSTIKLYMDGGPSPYGTDKKYPTKGTR